MVVLDTNIIIDHLRQSSRDNSLLIKISKQTSKDLLAMSIISVQELFEGMSTRQEVPLQILLSILSQVKILDYNYEIATMAGKIARDLDRPIGLADSAIAATCIYNDFELATLNTKHFKDIPELRLFDLN